MTRKLLIGQVRQFGTFRKSLALGLGLLLLAAFLSSCDTQEGETNGRLLLWHSLGDEDAAVLDQILDGYKELHPNVAIVREQIPVDEIQASYEQRVNEGLGPDMLLITDFRLFPLLAQGMIRDISDYDLDLSAYDPLALSQVQYRDQLVGLPFSTFSQVLCYNRELIENPPATLDELLVDVEDGHRIGQGADFSQLAWLMSALGGSFFDELGRVKLNEGEVATWLDWLFRAREHPNIIISPEMSLLEEALVAGEMTYFVCPSELVPELLDALGEDKLGVSVLPSQPGNTAHAYLATNVIAFNPAADPGSVARGLSLATFLTNPAQQTTLALEAPSQIPVNREVDIDSRLAPLEATLLAQPKTAASLDFIELELLSLELAEPYVGGVLAGEIDPAQAAIELTRLINDLWEAQG